MNTNLLSQLSTNPLYVIDPSIKVGEYVPLDLSVDNEALKEIDMSSAASTGKYVDRVVSEGKGRVAYGGYLEKRDLYSRSEYFKNSTDNRNIHLGVDLWIAAGTSVHAVWEGKVHSLGHNKNHGDYGPTIILEHEVNGFTFHSLYGHLSLPSIEQWTVGDRVTREEPIARLGDPTINGDYAPHLHFQIILDMEGMHGDYPGVSSESRLDFYKSNCPDPNLLLRLC